MSDRDELIEGLRRAWSGDLDAFLALYVEDCVFEDKAFHLVHRGHAGLREVFAFTYTMMPDFRVAYGERIIGADHAAAKWTFTGTFSGEFEGRQHARVPVRIEGVSFMTLRGGRIAHNVDYWNVADLAAQLAGKAGCAENDRG